MAYPNQPPNPLGFGYGYRQAPIGQPQQGGVGSGSPYSPGMLPGRRQAAPQQAPQQAPPSGVTDYDALIEAMMGQQMQQQGQRMGARGAGIAGAPNNRSRNIPAGLLGAVLGDRASKQGMEQQKNAILMQKEVDAKEKEKLEEAARQMAIIAGATPQQADAFAAAKANGLDADLNMFSAPDDRTAEVKNRSFRGEFLKNNPEVVERMGQQDADKFWLTGKWEDGEGLSITSRPDGTFTVTSGDRSQIVDPSGSVQTELQKGIREFEQADAAINQVVEDSREIYLTNKGRIGAWLGGKLDKAGLSDNDLAQFSAERGAWKNRVLDRVLEYRRAVTGQAGSRQELDRIEALRANPDMGPAEFARAVESEVDAIRNKYNADRTTQGQEAYDFEPFKFEFGGDKPTIEELMDQYPAQ